MIEACIYKITTGVITKTGIFPDWTNLAANVARDEAYIEAKADPRAVYVRNGEFVAYPPKLHPAYQWAGTEWIDPRTDAERAAEHETLWMALRAERDRLLTASDWTQAPDAPLTAAQRKAWKVYRQALRDIPQTTQNPAAPVWPVKP